MESVKKYYVYMHIFPNNKKYIGITCRKLQHRWGPNGNGYKPGKNRRPTKIWKAIQKYGWENVQHEVLYEGLTKEEACQKEIELIRLYRSNEHEFGYNISSGGENSSLSRETKEKLRQAKQGKNYGMIGENAPMYGKHHTKEAKQKISQATSGENNPFYGKHHSEETKKKLADFYSYKSKIVEQYDKAGNFINEYPSIHEAARATGIKRDCISAVINGRQRTAGKYIWKLKDTNSETLVNEYELENVS